MRSSFLILLCFLAGVFGGRFFPLPETFTGSELVLITLYALLFLVGVGVGARPDAWTLWRQGAGRLLLVPLAVVLGTLLGAGAVTLLGVGPTLREGLAVGSGLGYYSLSSVLIAQLHGETLGVMALLANVMRELMTLLLAPLLVRCCGRLAPVAAAGATAMDTTLPIITRFAGRRYALVAVFSGFLLTVLVPVLVTLILGGSS